MHDLNIIQGDLENFSHELGEVSTDVSTYTAHPLKLTLVQSAMPGGSSYKQAQYAGGHMEDELTALKTSFSTLAASATEYWATEDINQQSIQRVMASIPEPCPPKGPSKGE